MNPLRTILSTLLAFLVLVSSTNFIVGIHYCGKKVQHVALFQKAEKCENEKKLPPCHRQHSCCDDQVVTHKGEDLKNSSAQIHVVAPESMTLEHPSIIISEIIPSASVERTKYYNYDPPLRSFDFTIEYQVFLI